MGITLTVKPVCSFSIFRGGLEVKELDYHLILVFGGDPWTQSDPYSLALNRKMVLAITPLR